VSASRLVRRLALATVSTLFGVVWMLTTADRARHPDASSKE